MVTVIIRTDDGERVQLEINEQDHIFWQIGTAEPGQDEHGYCAWSDLESDLAEGMKGVKQSLIDAVQLWRDNYMIASPKSIAA